jgi:hypothetical protein
VENVANCAKCGQQYFPSSAAWATSAASAWSARLKTRWRRSRLFERPSASRHDGQRPVRSSHSALQASADRRLEVQSRDTPPRSVLLGIADVLRIREAGGEVTKVRQRSYQH